MIYYRPEVHGEYFKDTHPKLYEEYRNGTWYSFTFPCHEVPVQRVHVWNNRKLFVKLVGTAVYQIERIRDTDCDSPEHWIRQRNFTLGEMRRKLRRDRIATAGINFLHGVAFQNFFCV